MRLIDLARDDCGDLEGRVLVFGELKTKSKDCVIAEWHGKKISVENGHVFATFNSTDPEDIMEKCDIPKEDLREMIDGLKRESAEYYGRENTDGSECRQFYQFPISMRSKEELIATTEDEDEVVYVGAHSNPEKCFKLIDMAENVYLIRLAKQIKRKTTTHLDFNGKQINEYLLQTYVLPMMKAQSAGEVSRVKELGADFLRFSNGSGFCIDAEKMCKLIEKCNDCVFMGMIRTKYLGKMNAIHLEKYEAASELAAQIKELEGLLRSV